MNFDVSVVIPMYNSSKTIIRALESVALQTVQVKEIIVIDDGSVDESSSIVQEYSLKSNIDIILVKKKNGGVSSARNKGMSIAKGEFVAFLDSDDEWVPEKLEVQMPFFSEDGVVLVGGHHKPLSGNSYSNKKTINVNDQFLKNNFQTSTVVIKNHLAKKFGGFYEPQKYAEEGRFYFEMLKLGSLVLVQKQLVIYDGGDKAGFGESGLSQNIQMMHQGELSNFRYAKKIHNISNFKYSLFILLSYLKYFRRFCLVKLTSWKVL